LFTRSTSSVHRVLLTAPRCSTRRAESTSTTPVAWSTVNYPAVRAEVRAAEL